MDYDKELMKRMDAVFLRVVGEVIENEGGLSDRKGDKGGLTYCGICEKYFPYWEGWGQVKGFMRIGQLTQGDVIDDPIMVNMVREFYYCEYWEKLGLQDLPEKLAFHVMDMCANRGTTRAVRKLQRVYNLYMGYGELEEDGKLGPVTRHAFNKGYKLWCEGFIELINIMRLIDYSAVILADKPQLVNLGGWFDRVGEKSRLVMVIEELLRSILERGWV